MRRVVLPLVGAVALHAGMMDFRTLDAAKQAYEGNDYAKASTLYGEVKTKNDQARFNYGDALYKEKKYSEAADVFSTISDPALKRQALYNLGNSLALSGKTDEAVKAYEASLKLGDDEDTRYNLELLKKQQQQNQQNKQDDKNDKNDKKNQDQQDKDKKGQDGQEKQDQKQQDQRSGNKGDERRDAKQKDQNKQDQQQKQQAADAKQKEKGDEQAQEGADAQAAMAEPISDMEERKYNKLLDKRGIKTLMIPLAGKGEPREDETTPW